MLSALAVTGFLAASLGLGEPMPPLKGEFLTGEKAVLPEAASGKYAFLAFGFTYNSRFAVEAWTKRFRGEFGSRDEVTFFEIPMIGGMARLGKWFIDSGMRKGTPASDHRHVITVYGGTDPWKKWFSFSRSDDAYLVLLDPSGRILWKHSGPMEDAAYAEMAALLNGHLAGESPSSTIPATRRPN